MQIECVRGQISSLSGRLWPGEWDAIEYAKSRSRSHDAVIRVYDEAGNVIETQEHAGNFREA